MRKSLRINKEIKRNNLSLKEISLIRSLSCQINIETTPINDATSSFEEEKEMSDALEEFLGEDKYIELFFTTEQIMSLNSARNTYEKLRKISNLKDSKVKDLLEELNPDKLYKAYKYMPNLKSFNEVGVRKMLESPEVSAAEKKFLIWNLDKVQDDGVIVLNFKELIYNRFIKGKNNE